MVSTCSVRLWNVSLALPLWKAHISGLFINTLKKYFNYLAFKGCYSAVGLRPSGTFWKWFHWLEEHYWTNIIKGLTFSGMFLCLFSSVQWKPAEKTPWWGTQTPKYQLVKNWSEKQRQNNIMLLLFICSQCVGGRGRWKEGGLTVSLPSVGKFWEAQL